MKYTIENFISMVMAVIAKCRENQTIVDGSVSFKAAFTLLVTHFGSVQEWLQVKNETTKGKTTVKKEARLAAVDGAITIVKAMKSYAFDNKLTEMLSNLKVNRSGLMNGRDTKCLDKLKYIHSLAVANKDNLKDYGVEDAQVTALGLLIQAYETAIPGPRALRNKLKNATAQIKKECRELSDILNNSMDPGSEQFRQNFEDFFNEYNNARIVVDLKGPSTGLKGTVIDSVSKIKLKRVQISAVEAGANTVSSKKGNYSFKKLSPGFYTITVKLAGYDELTLANVEVKAGAVSDFNIQLVKTVQQNIAA